MNHLTLIIHTDESVARAGKPYVDSADQDGGQIIKTEDYAEEAGGHGIVRGERRPLLSQRRRQPPSA